MPSFNIDYNFSDHPKVLRLIGRLGNGADAVLVRLWNFTAKFFGDDGFIRGYTAAEVEASLRWWGEPGKCIEAMTSLGFLHAADDGYQVHDWLDNQAHIPAYREKARMMNERRIEKVAGNAKKKAATQAPTTTAKTAKTTTTPQSDYVVNDVVDYVENKGSDYPNEPSALQCNAMQGNAKQGGAKSEMPPPSSPASFAATYKTPATKRSVDQNHDPPSSASPQQTQKLQPSEDLAQRFWFAQVGKKADVYATGEIIAEMLRVGYSIDAIRAEIDSPSRDRSEPFFKLKDRLERAKNGTARPGKGEMSMSDEEKRLRLLGRWPK